MNFYSVIIGTELLNGRRSDKHFNFLNDELNKRGLNHTASFVIKDTPELIKQTFEFIKQDKDAVMFSFGGIGATPDDLTRQIASQVFTCKDLELHEEAKTCIENQFGSEAYPHRINMAMLPPNAKLLKNVVNNVPGFYLENRYFFTPGFPSMSWPMVTWALDTFFESQIKPYSYNFRVFTGESDLIDMMQQIPNEIEVSSLPRMLENNKRSAEIYMSSFDKKLLNSWYKKFKKHISEHNFSVENLV